MEGSSSLDRKICMVTLLWDDNKCVESSTFKDIGSRWGEFIQVHDKTMRQESYDNARILIVTENEGEIEDQIQLKVNGMKYLVKMKEMKTFRVFKPDELDDPKDHRDDILDLVNDMEVQRDLEDDKVANIESGIWKILRRW